MQIFVILIVLVISINFVTALGVTPARKLFDYGEGLESGELRIINSQNKDLKLAVYATGDYADAISFEKDVIYISASESAKTVGYTLTMPENLAPGRQSIDLIILELPTELKEGNTVITDNGVIIMQDKKENEMLSATTAVIAKVFIDVPYPGKYINADLHVSSANTDETITFAVSLFGKGEENIDDVGGVIIIKGPTNEEIARVQTTSRSLGSGEDGKIVANWKAGVNPGVYYAEAVINFDGEQIVKRTTFMVGSNNLKIKDILIDKFKLGQIAKVDVIAESVWNEEIKDVYAELDILDERGISLRNVKTSAINIPSLGTGILSGYWDTEGMVIGNYDISVKLFYENKISEKLFQAIINADNIQISDTAAIAGQVIKESGEGSSTISLLIMAVIILIVINISWLLYFKKFKKKKE